MNIAVGVLSALVVFALMWVLRDPQKPGDSSDGPGTD